MTINDIGMNAAYTLGTVAAVLSLMAFFTCFSDTHKSIPSQF